MLDLRDYEEPESDGIAVLGWDDAAFVADGPISSWIPIEELWTKDDFEVGGFVGRELTVAGYPDVPGFSTDRPCISDGVIASDPRHAVDVDGQHEHAILYRGVSWSGMSGGPVMATQVGFAPSASMEVRGYLPMGLVGVNFGHIVAPGNSGHSGWSGLFPAWMILDRLHEIVGTA